MYFGLSKLSWVIGQVENNLGQAYCWVVAGTALDWLKVDLRIEGKGWDKGSIEKKFFGVLWIFSFSYDAGEKEKKTAK